MSIIACPLCIKGRIRKFAFTDEWGYRGGHYYDTCPRCNGTYRWRDPPDEWTRLEDLPEDILRSMARIRQHCRIDYENGRLFFVATLAYPVPEDPERLLNLIDATSKLGHALEAHNWLVSY
jgi:hypothetical protein